MQVYTTGLSAARCAFRTLFSRKPVNVVTFMTLQCRRVQPNRAPADFTFQSRKPSIYCTSKRCLNFTAASRTSKNYYEVLGIPKNASTKQIKNAYFKLAMQHHPDKNQGVLTQRFKDIKEAYDVLSNESSRMQYNNSECSNVLNDSI